METLNLISDIASIISLFISGFIAYKISTIQSNAQFGQDNKTSSQSANGNSNRQSINQ